MFEHGLLWATVLLSWTLLKASLAATLVIYPSYKSYKALESRSLQAAQGMLLYWIMTAFVNSLKEMADQVLGTYSNVFIWKLTVLALKAAPLIIGPERMYTMIIRPLFDANAEQVDAVVDEAHKLRSMAKDAIPAAKAGDVAAVKGKAGEIASEVKDATSELVETAVETLKEKTAVLQEKTEALGVTLNKEGAMAMLAQLMSGVETVRDAGVDAAASTWKTHGPMITEKAGLARNKTSELYQTHAPVVQQKLLSTYQTTVLPRVQPVFNTMSAKYNDSIKPVALAQKEKANALWQQHGGPVRKFYSERALPLYRTKLQPFYQTQLKPWVLHSFLPAVWETLLALKDRLMDLINPPTEEVKSARAGAKLRRREANERRSQWKRRGDKVKDKWAGEWQAMEKEKELSPAASSSSDSTSVAEAALASAATLTNRKTKQSTDSSLERSHVIPPEESQLDPSAPAFEPSAPLKEESLLVKESALPAPVADSAKLQGDKLGNSPDLTKEGANFQGERSGRIVEPIQ